MTKQFCDCCEDELSKDNRAIASGGAASLGEVHVHGPGGSFSFDVKVAHSGGRGQSDTPDICKKCLLRAMRTV
jgi:hypothetical protein